ncbi:MAG: bifunctional UDP-N-acetylglucosamine diphosphorylase/glucosamine-1-phosphate N-acetyltransferase GlmU [Elusimicrobia bacterium]|nr:bifunctional UDP-N-acetylglucosamine diphosphorylase/glucosamine-1-phosphate N-acetyltransferase GlmU [Elusimicrobiota bacterium]
MKNFSAVILAAGKGTRMKSAVPKVLHEVSLTPMLGRVIESVSALSPDRIAVVVGSGAGAVEDYLKTLKTKTTVIYQDKQLGSGHALKQAQNAFKNYKGNILVLSGDVPLIEPLTLKKLLSSHIKKSAGATVLSAKLENPFGYGRMVTGLSGTLTKIVEEKDASAEQKAIKEINAGIYCFNKVIWDILPRLKNNNAKKEYYITDAVEYVKSKGFKDYSCVASCTQEVQGINNRLELANAETYLQRKTLSCLMDKGVTVMSPNSVYIASDAQIGADTVIYPNVFIGRNVKVGKNCLIGSGSFIKNSLIGDNAKIEHSYINGARLAKGVKVGPFAHIRPESVLCENARLGNFSEVKKSVIGAGAKINHLSYIGDAHVGKAANIGAGTITCNYDGKSKHRTVIGEGAFVGSNVNFIAPVSVGKNVLVAAGSTITKNVPENTLVVARARQVSKPNRRA